MPATKPHVTPRKQDKHFTATGAASTPGSSSAGPVAPTGITNIILTSTTISSMENSPVGLFFNPTPSIRNSVWHMTTHMFQTVMGTYQSEHTPSTHTLRRNLTRGMKMLELYGKLKSGAPLSRADVQAAQEFGGPVARAAELIGMEKAQHPQHVYGMTIAPSTPERPSGRGGKAEGTQGPRSVEGTVVTKQREELALAKEKGKPTVIGGGRRTGPTVLEEPPNRKRARQEAIAELLSRIHTTLGLTQKELANIGGPVSKSLTTMMQNAGYYVRSNMTLAQAIGAMSKGATAQTPGTLATTPRTVGEYVQNLATGKMTGTQIWSLQKALYRGGFFDNEYYGAGPVPRSYTSKQLTGGTIYAFRTAVEMTATWNAHHPKRQRTVMDTIQGGAGPYEPTVKGNQYGGVYPTGTPTGKVPHTTVYVATPQEALKPLESAFATYLGRLPSQKELQQFTAYYTSLMQTANKQMVDRGLNPLGQGYVTYTSHIPFVPHVPSVGAAAEAWAQQQNPTEYQARNVADAYGMLMNLIDRQNVSAYTTPGTRPLTMS